MKVWIVRGDHPDVPGLREVVCATRARAVIEAHQLLDVISQDIGAPVTEKVRAMPITDRLVLMQELWKHDPANSAYANDEFIEWGVDVSEAEVVD